jgi:hypothetical protein
MSIEKFASLSRDHFGSTSPFKVRVNFDILIFEGQIEADALDKWLNLLEGYFSVHNFSDRENITSILLKDLPMLNIWRMAFSIVFHFNCRPPQKYYFIPPMNESERGGIIEGWSVHCVVRFLHHDNMATSGPISRG